MANIEQLNKFVELKQKTSADVRQLGQVVSAREEQVSTDAQTVINLANFVVNQDQKEAFLLFIDGQGPLVEGAGNDFTFTNIVSNTSAQITLNSPLAAGLNIVALKIGTSIAPFPNPSSVQAALNNDVGTPKSLITDGFQNFVAVPKIACPNTTVVNRALISDLANDLKPRMGIERIHARTLIDLHNESAPSGMPVFGLAGDHDNLVRLVGYWTNENSSNGRYVRNNVVDAYIEITFYGTGLNLLCYSPNAAGTDYRVSVDGGAEGGNIVLAQTGSVLNAREYNPNVIIKVVAGLSLGIHTVKIRQTVYANSLNFMGYEVLNESSTIKINPGSAHVSGVKRQLLAQSLQAYNSGFESGTLGTRGGRALVYLKSDGTIGKSVQPVNVSQANLTSADHSNEELARAYHWREFGSARSDDFSTLVTQSNRAFTLEDGTTNLSATDVTIMTGQEKEGLAFNALNGFAIFTFVGTGLDIMLGATDAATYASNYSVWVDGIALATNVASSTLFGRSTRTQPKVLKIVSGLPYGTHTFKIQITSFGVGESIIQFFVYHPKKPSIPAGAIELADYNIMADFVPNTVAGVDTIATGVLRKSSQRELFAVNGSGGTVDWQIQLDVANKVMGWDFNTNRQNAYVDRIFFGTGFDCRFQISSNRSSNIQVQLGVGAGTPVDLNTTNFPSMVSSVYGTGAAFNAATGVLDQLDAGTVAGAGFRVSGLPLGLYKVRLFNNVASSYVCAEAFDIITPIHAPLMMTESSSNSAPVGSCALADSRVTSPVYGVQGDKAFAQAISFVSTPTTTSTFFVPLQDMSVTITLKKAGRIRITGHAGYFGSAAGATGHLSAYLDGKPVGIGPRGQSTINFVVSVGWTGEVAAGTHKIDLYWATNAANTVTAEGRILIVEEV
jgi:hypothetical protein